MLRIIIKTLFLVILGILIGFIAYEAIMFIRISQLRTGNPVTTSLIEARASEAEALGEQPKRLQVWVPLGRISPNLQRAVLAGRTQTSPLTMASIMVLYKKHGTMGCAMQHAKQRKKERMTTGCQTYLNSNAALLQSHNS